MNQDPEDGAPDAPNSGVVAAAAKKKTKKQRERGPSHAELLVELILRGSTLLRDTKDVTYMKFEGKKSDLVRLEKSWEARVANDFRKVFGEVIGGNAIKDAARVLTGIAGEDPPVEVFVRTASHGGNVYIDRANSDGDVVMITPDGWSIIQDPPVYFYRPKGLRALPRPVDGGDLAALKQLLNVTTAQFVLVVAWLVGALRGSGPYAILNIFAEHGGAKTTLMRILRRLVDPNASEVRAPPREERELAISASNALLLAYDNLSITGSSTWLSDALCRVATGGGIAPRKLFTDSEEALFDYVRPIILTSIDEIAERADLGDRCLTLHLRPIPPEARKTEDELFAEFERIAPGCFGRLLDAVSCALARMTSTRLVAPPRLADFATFVTAAEPALGWKEGTFLRAYRANLRIAAQSALDADPVTAAVCVLLDRRPYWSGTATQLLDALHDCVPDEVRRAKRWPLQSNHLSNRLRRVTPALRQVGIEVFERRRSAMREITLRRSAAANPTSQDDDDDDDDDASPAGD